MFESRSHGTAKIMMNTMISASTGGISALFIRPLIMRTRVTWDLSAVCNGILTGLVSITGVCDNTEIWYSAIIGIIASLFYSLGCKLLLKAQVDDPLEATPVHGFGGIWGLIAVAIFDNKNGIVSNGTNKVNFVGAQFAGMFTIITWTSLLSFLFFYIMKRMNLLRVVDFEEILGLDYVEMGSMNKMFIEKINRIKMEAEYEEDRRKITRRNYMIQQDHRESDFNVLEETDRQSIKVNSPKRKFEKKEI